VTVLVIGGAEGMLAGALARRAGIIALGRPYADLGAPETLAPLLETHDPRAVICAGAYTQVDAAEDDEATALRINAEGPGALARLCADRGAPLIFVSTDYVFDGAKGGAYVESDATAPINAYGRSKLAGEAAVRAAGGRHAIIRTSWIHAPWGRNFVRTMLDRALRGMPVRVVDDQFGAPTYAPHLADALLAVADALVADGARSGTYHLTNAGACSWRDFAEAIFAGAAGRGGPTTSVTAIATADYPTRATRPRNSRLDSSAAHAAFGLRLPDWRVGLDACLDALAASGWRLNPP
jgi:dTDP-4-dehydrorhamnose reductase